jgi:TetR/AcrR family tetracycline transcriptional repressor
MAAQKRLNRDELISTALAVADAEGLDAVTVRRVAQAHDVTPMALYRHFPDKDGLLDAIAERLLTGAVPPEPDDRPWHRQMHDLLSSLLAALRPHPNATPLVLTRIMLSEAGLAMTERCLALLAEGGLSVDEGAETACQVLSTLVTLVVTEPGRMLGEDRQAHEAALRTKRAGLLALDPARYPHVVAAAAPLTDCPSDDSYYARGIDMIVTGMRGATGARQPA